MIFTHLFFQALDDWQKGWKEDQQRKDKLAEILEEECAKLPRIYKEVPEECFRKRFLHKGEFVDILLNDEKHEGITSWTTDLNWAERFKGLWREDVITAAIFRCTPNDEEVILNISCLWNSPDFQKELSQFQRVEPDHCKAILNFKNLQSEVILKTVLRGSEIIALTGFSSPFEDLCERANISEDRRDELFAQFIEEGRYPEGVSYIKDENAQRAIKNTIRKFLEKVLAMTEN